MYSGISVDLISLEQAYHHLLALAQDIEDKMLCIRQEYNIISGMSLDEIEEELLHVIHRLSEIYDDVLRRARALKRISELYEECEESNCRMVEDLPSNMLSSVFSDDAANYKFSGAPIPGIDYRLGEYASGYFILDPWLDDLIN